MPRNRKEPIRVLFTPKHVSNNAALTDAAYYGRVDSSCNIAGHFARIARVRSADITTPRYVAGQSKAITAEIHYSDKLWSTKDLQRERNKRY